MDNSAAKLGGRLLLALIFVLSGFSKVAGFSSTLQMMQAKHIPLAAVALVVTILLEVLGGLALILGIRTRWAALLLFLYLIPVTLMFHNFWAYSGQEHMMQQAHFMKNIAIMGGLLFVYGSAPGRFAATRD